MAKKTKLSMSIDENLVNIVDELAEKLGETRTAFTRNAWHLRITHLKESNLIETIDKVTEEIEGKATAEIATEGA